MRTQREGTTMTRNNSWNGNGKIPIYLVGEGGIIFAYKKWYLILIIMKAFSKPIIQIIHIPSLATMGEKFISQKQKTNHET